MFGHAMFGVFKVQYFGVRSKNTEKILKKKNFNFKKNDSPLMIFITPAN